MINAQHLITNAGGCENTRFHFAGRETKAAVRAALQRLAPGSNGPSQPAASPTPGRPGLAQRWGSRGAFGARRHPSLSLFPSASRSGSRQSGGPRRTPKAGARFERAVPARGLADSRGPDLAQRLGISRSVWSATPSVALPFSLRFQVRSAAKRRSAPQTLALGSRGPFDARPTPDLTRLRL